MHPIPNKRSNFIWFVCNRIINIINAMRKHPFLSNKSSYERVFPKLTELHFMLKYNRMTLNTQVSLFQTQNLSYVQELIFYKLLLDFYHHKLSLFNDPASLLSSNSVLYPSISLFYRLLYFDKQQPLSKLFSELNLLENEWLECKSGGALNESTGGIDERRAMFRQLFFEREGKMLEKAKDWIEWVRRAQRRLRNGFKG